MKRLTIIFALLFVLFSNISIAQYYTENWSTDQHKRDLYERKVSSYGKMKNVGWTLTAVGSGLTLMGIVLVSSADWETYTNSSGQPQYTSSDASGSIGILSLFAGIPTAITGVVLGSIGNKKQNEYFEKLQRLDMSYQRYDDYNSIKLVYRF